MADLNSDWAHELVACAQDRSLRFAFAESLTGGLLADAVVTVPGASSVFAGGVVTYATESKVQVLGVDAATIASQGVVSAAVALEMARSAARIFQVPWAVATTGVAGPGAQDRVPAGTVWLAIYGPDVELTQCLALAGDRQQVRMGTVRSAGELLLKALTNAS